MQKKHAYLFLILTILLSGCWSGTTEYEGLRFPETEHTAVTFQEKTVAADCSAFAHLFMNTTMGATGLDIANAMKSEAQAMGANQILIGMARELPEEEFSSNRFDYYGPEYAYTFHKTWLGWKFGFDEWDEAADFVGLGVNKWGKEDVLFDNSILIQAVFLRCGEDK